MILDGVYRVNIDFAVLFGYSLFTQNEARKNMLHQSPKTHLATEVDRIISGAAVLIDLVLSDNEEPDVMKKSFQDVVDLVIAHINKTEVSLLSKRDVWSEQKKALLKLLDRVIPTMDDIENVHRGVSQITYPNYNYIYFAEILIEKAIQENDYAFVEKLLGYGVTKATVFAILERNKIDLKVTLEEAAKKGCFQYVKLLLQHERADDIYDKDSTLFTCIHQVIIEIHTLWDHFLAESDHPGASLAIGPFDRLEAHVFSYRQIIKHLIAAGADPHSINENKESAMQLLENVIENNKDNADFKRILEEVREDIIVKENERKQVIFSSLQGTTLAFQSDEKNYSVIDLTQGFFKPVSQTVISNTMLASYYQIKQGK